MPQTPGNLFDLTGAGAEEESFQTLLQAPGVRIERILSSGQFSPAGFWYDQAEEEWVAVLHGSAELEFANGERRRLAAGDHLLIPAHLRHRVIRTDNPTLWLAVFYPAAAQPRQEGTKS